MPGHAATASGSANRRVASLPVLIRRQRPLLALVAGMLTLYVVMAVVDIYETVPFPSMVAGYCVALVHSRRTTVIVGLALVPPVLFAIAFFGDGGGDLLVHAGEIPKNLGFVAAPLLLGLAVRNRRDYLAEVLERAETAERTREEEARLRVGEERLRIARDVHDVVAHAMVAINVQAGVGAHLLDRDPERARSTLLDIKRVSGEALADLRATLGALRAGDTRGARPAHPGVGRARGAGRRSAVGRDRGRAGRRPRGDRRPLRRGRQRLPDRAGGPHQRRPARTGRARARAGGARARSCRGRGDRRRPGAIPVGAPAPDGTGHGLRGMRERALAVGGTLDAGPIGDGGWRVCATLPVATS